MNFKSVEKFNANFVYLFSHQVQVTKYLTHNNHLLWSLRNSLPTKSYKKNCKKKLIKKRFILITCNKIQHGQNKLMMF